ncbi:MAG TPA: FAD-dependent oxidoreductase [Gaiellaceae bacterium]|nr:FAD-dependent oxidoreductase [Gaiellaceae bacterium]
MTVAAIVAVSGDAVVLDAVEAQLAGRYAHDYRIECLRDPDDAVALLETLADDEVEVALLLATQATVEVTGTELLDATHRFHPQAKRAMLVSTNAWTDVRTAEAIRAAVALGRLDHFLLEPGPPPDEVFHEAVQSFLLEWARERRLVPQTVHIVGEEWSGRARELRDVLESCAAPHAFCLADSDKGRELLAKAPPGAELPLMALPDGRVLSNPSNAEIAAAAGAPQALGEQTFELLVVGAGPAGLSTAVYSASEGLSVLVVDAGGIGGQARSSSLIRNYLGFAKGVSGSRLAEQAYDQASAFGASFLFMHSATALGRTGDEIGLSLDDGRSIRARAVVLAMGASYERIGIPELEELSGAGVFYGGPASEAHGLTGADVYVVGGGNSAGQAALHLARYARRVTMLVRAGALGTSMSHYLVHAIGANPGIEVLAGTAVTGGGGEGHLQHLVIRDLASGAEQTVSADALFVLIGSRPRTDWLPLELAQDEHGFLLTGDDVGSAWPLERHPFALETSMPGVLAVGDVRHGSVKRVAAAVGEGATAVQLVHRLLAEEQRPVATPR